MTEPIKDRDYYVANRSKYQFPKFTLDTPHGMVEFVVAIPVDKYDAFAIIELFEKRSSQGLLDNSNKKASD